ncbi:hypothetical protein DYI37_03630 [Fulvimarina endophytica]|uniref:Uncharacterized protein n=1 Tax=Fulvimarina endophytica TaxID=2293836 RepID=A0A371X6W8_9HYPH|nr:hypothetical protein [Fulvimarina endophytica]RFC64970.1 hypothetical protein DYI37_03630 [Fulvimarina endophytica]
MRSQLPSLYRALEKPKAANGYDAIATAAALNFLALPSPSKRQEKALTSLIAPVWSHLAAETQAYIKAEFAQRGTVPAAIRAIYETSAGGAPVTSSAESASPIADMGVLAETAVGEPRPERTARSAQEARDTLKFLVAKPERPRNAPKGKKPIVEIARSRNIDALRDFLAQELFLGQEEAARFLSSADSPLLLAALKALDLSTSDAMTILMFVDETVATSISAFTVAKNQYEQLSFEAAAARLGLAPIEGTPAARHEPLSADLPSPNRSDRPRRAFFGRRFGTANLRKASRS